MTQPASSAQALQGRLVSLDVFRGLTMAAMVIVNNPGDWNNAYWPLLHADWNGWTPTDLIFPFFLFIVGVAMTLSQSTTGSPWRIVRRGVTIMALGWFLSGFPYFRLETWRVYGVLVRIGLCYMAAAWLFRVTAPAGEPDDRRHGRRLMAVAAGLSVIYWAAMVFLPYPGHVAGDLTPAGNLGAFIDRSLVGTSHLWSRRPWDPEGLSSTIPAVATTVFGLVAGLWLRAGVPGAVKALVLAATGVAAIAVGLVWDLAFPINKNLWTSSYVWFTGGAAAVGLSACYWAIDVVGWRSWTRPFVILGVNAITLFVLAGLTGRLFILIKLQDAAGKSVPLQALVYRSWYEPLAAPRNASLLFAATYLAVLYVILWGMYRRRWFLRV